MLFRSVSHPRFQRRWPAVLRLPVRRHAKLYAVVQYLRWIADRFSGVEFVAAAADEVELFAYMEFHFQKSLLAQIVLL